MKNLLAAISCLLVVSCGQGKKETTVVQEAPKDSVINRVAKIPLEREVVKTEPVAEYRVRTENPLNDWYFQVRLYETSKTFHYLIKLQYEEIRGEDTLKLPNFGTIPQPVIQKGPEQYSCIIGFMDKDNKFREYKKAFVKENTLKIVALKHYGVRDHQYESD